MIVYTHLLHWEYYCGKRETMHTPVAYHNQKDPKTSLSLLLPREKRMDSSLTIKEYAFTSPFPMQRNPSQIVKWHPGASTQSGHDMHWGLLMCQYRTTEWCIFAGPGFSQYSLKRSLVLKAALQVLPRQNRPSANLNWDPFKKHEKKKAQTLNPVGPLSEHKNKATLHPTPSSVSSRQDLPRSQCSLEKMSLVGRSWHDYKTQAREELWFELSHSLSSLT